MKWILLGITGVIFSVGMNTIMNGMEDVARRSLKRSRLRKEKKRIEELCKKAVPDYEARTREERAKIRRIIKNTISWGKELDRIYDRKDRRRRKVA